MGIVQPIATIDQEKEKQIITSMIVSTEVLRSISKFAEPQLFELPYCRILCELINQYFAKYAEAPEGHIGHLYSSNQNKMREADQELLEGFLVAISEEYEDEDEPPQVNAPYSIDTAIEYFQSQALLRNAQQIMSLLDRGLLKEAQALQANFGKEAGRIGMSKWDAPFDDLAFINKVYEEEENPLLVIRGKWGELIGPLKRTWLMGVMAPEKRGKCICAGSTLLLGDGRVKKIEDIVKDGNTNILTLTDDLKIVKGTISHHYDNGIKPVYKVTTKTGREVSTTLNHPYLTIHGWKDLSELSEGDHIAVPRSLPFFGKGTLPDAKLKILAYMIADGNYQIMTFTKGSKEIAADFISAVQSVGDVVRKNPDSDKTQSYAITNTEGHVPRPSNTRAWFRSMEIPDRQLSKNKTIPEVIFTLNKNCLKLFLSTLFTCDGTVHKGGNSSRGTEVSYGTASKKLAHQIQHLLLRFGIVSKLYERTAVNHYKGVRNEFLAYVVQVRDKSNVLRFGKEIGFRFEKQQRYEQLTSRPCFEEIKEDQGRIDAFPQTLSEIIKDRIAQNPEQVAGKKYANRIAFEGLESGYGLTRHTVSILAHVMEDDYLKTLLNADVIWDKIEAIDYVGEEQTYDLTVPDTHNFIANDIIVHNTFTLWELAFECITHGLRVAFVTLEMESYQISLRSYKRISSTADNAGRYDVPVFDCLHNQNNECDNPNRTCNIEAPEKYNRDIIDNYTPCTYCRELENDRFAATSWFITREREATNRKTTRQQVKAVQNLFGINRYRQIYYPEHSANIQTLKQDLDILEHSEGFVPDVIVIDYADILAPEDSRIIGRDRIDDTWKALKNLAATRQCLVIAASQTTRKSHDMDTIGFSEVSEDKRKIAHCDLALTLNQMELEKEWGKVRIGILVHRHKEFRKSRMALVLQQLGIAQPVLDSEIIIHKPPEKKKKDDDNDTNNKGRGRKGKLRARPDEEI